MRLDHSSLDIVLEVRVEDVQVEGVDLGPEFITDFLRSRDQAAVVARNAEGGEKFDVEKELEGLVLVEVGVEEVLVVSQDRVDVTLDEV